MLKQHLSKMVDETKFLCIIVCSITVDFFFPIIISLNEELKLRFLENRSEKGRVIT